MSTPMVTRRWLRDVHGFAAFRSRCMSRQPEVSLRPPERVPYGPAPRDRPRGEGTVMTRRPRAGILPSVRAIVSHNGNGAESAFTRRAAMREHSGTALLRQFRDDHLVRRVDRVI